ncbi:FtsX-like permease family protein [Streptomyces sp. PSKA30]|uniref:FtsX-like permease family protein n=1 Tax=Streptomyces sp. PSKA30 TaxID=2874597 RepID=UPI001CD0E3DD|nr:FtsX-like permease family protein [Streptomyces sp. PSKA30]MBZ9643558.1 ABC transporter permease [Streptomyces sp. PSKA30]
MRAEIRLAGLLTRGSNRHEWWRITLTAFGALLATGFALAAVTLAALRGHHRVPFANGLLNNPGEREGVVVALLLLLIPVFGFLGQCARIGAVHRDRRLAGLRLAGASPWQVRRIAAAEAGLACLVGSAVGTVFSVLLLLVVWEVPSGYAWAGIAVVAVAVPVIGALVSVLALRRVVASPLGWVRRIRPQSRPGLMFLLAVLLFGGVALGSYAAVSDPARNRSGASGPLLVFALLIVTGTAALWLVGATARLTGRLLASRTDRPALLIAAERLRDDPWAAARTHAAVLLVTIVGTAFVGIRQVLLEVLHSDKRLSEDASFYTTGLDLTAAAIAMALAITLSSLAVGTAESLATRRRGLAAQAAAGVPPSVLSRALLLETALPLAPAVLLAGAGGMAIGTGYAGLADGGGWSTPWAALLVPAGVYAACLLAAVTSLPLLRRSVRPGELRYA